MLSQKLVEDNMSLVFYLVHKHYPTYAKDEDVLQSGMFGLCKAANTWDESKSKFSTYAAKCIINAIRNELAARAKHSGILSLDYEVENDDGTSMTFGDIIPGDTDVDYIDVPALYDRLGERDKKIFELRKKGLDTQTISDILDITPVVVRQRLRKIKAIWRDLND